MYHGPSDPPLMKYLVGDESLAKMSPCEFDRWWPAQYAGLVHVLAFQHIHILKNIQCHAYSSVQKNGGCTNCINKINLNGIGL